MRNLLILLLLCLNLTMSGTTYYVSLAGNDASNGLSESTAWKSITKVNSVFSTFKPGDKILFRKGDPFYGSLTVTVPGTSGNPITIGSYGTGNNAVISGFTTLTGWTNYGGGIYSKAVSCESTPNILLLDDINTPLGRSPIGKEPTAWPSNTPKTDATTQTSITDADLPSSPNLVGAEVAIRTAEWIIERRTILTHSGQTITFAATGYTTPVNTGYFIQNHISTLNLLGEWCYSGGTLYMYFGADNPTNHTIKVPVLNNLINCNYNYIVIDGLSLQGSNQAAINMSNADYVTIKNNTISFNGGNGTYTTYCDYLTVNSNTFDNNNNVSINCLAYQSGTNASITYNTITNNGIILGQAYSNNEGSIAIVCDGHHGDISHNSITNAGFMGIRWGGQGTHVTYNYITNILLNKYDGGGIYSYRDFNTDKLVDHNIVVNIARIHYGWKVDDETTVSAIYFDGPANVTCTNNIVGNVEGKAIFINCAQNITAEYNTTYNTSYGIWVHSEPDSRPSGGVDGRARGHVVRYNTVVAKDIAAENFVLYLLTRNDLNDLSQFGTIDYNYYASLVQTDDYISRWYEAYKWQDPYFQKINLTEVRTLGYDASSTLSSTRVTDVNKIRFEYNATNVNKIVTLDAGYIDVKGTKYSGNITLLPYTSVILLPDPNSSVAPASPVYVSSSVENATPSILEMTYNLTLANIMPAAASFSVMVNSVARTVNKVVISGTKVQLTLASPIVSGDIVTISYTKPTSNPIQTSTGVVATSISNQLVNNNCINIAPSVTINSPVTNSSYSASENITITATALDTDGSVTLVEFYNGSTRLGSKSSAPYSFTWNNVAAGTYSLTVIATDNLTARTTSSSVSISVVNGTPTENQPPVITISNPIKGNKFEKLATITIDAIASDADGTISKVEFYSGTIKLVELTSAPYSFTWKDVAAGSYSITAIATDNSTYTTISAPVEFVVGSKVIYDANSEIINLYPNPNDGHFSIAFINPLQNEKSNIEIIDMAGKQVYNGPILKEETLKQIDLSDSKPGVYIMIVKDKEILVTKKFIKK